ncbi:Butirosin biosynthesis, BtrG-like protein, partial [Kalaharituber pfeilii]
RYYYFAYGSNLWHSQMSHRCPSSRLIGTGYLHGYRWIISARGYANVVPSHSPSPCTSANTDGTYGAIYTLSPTDLATLDLYEGVDVTPVPCYLKVTMPIRLLSAPGPEKGVDVIPCLVYVDPRTQEGVVREEYIRRINLGLRDAGLPKEWVRKVVRRWIPTE